MNRLEIDVLWQKAMHEAIKEGCNLTRYHFAAMLRDKIKAEALADHSGDANEMVAMKECRHCGWLCKSNDSQSKKFYPLQEPVKQKPCGYLYDFDYDNELVRDWFTQSTEKLTEDGAFNIRPVYIAPVQPVKHEPEWYHSVDNFGCNHFYSKDEVRPTESKPLYAAPVDAKAIRAEALEEAAKMCEEHARGFDEETDNARLWCAAAIRGLK